MRLNIFCPTPEVTTFETGSESAFVFDDDFTGIIKCTLPSFWSEEFSHVYANFDLTKMQGEIAKDQELNRVVADETKLLEVASLDRNILELRKQGMGIETISKQLGCSTWRVRKAIEGLDKP